MLKKPLFPGGGGSAVGSEDGELWNRPLGDLPEWFAGHPVGLAIEAGTRTGFGDHVIGRGADLACVVSVQLIITNILLALADWLINGCRVWHGLFSAIFGTVLRNLWATPA